MYIERHLNKKFHNDKVFQKNDDYFVAIDGIILDSPENLFDYIIGLYKEFGLKFIAQLEGNFCGIFSDIKNETHFIFNNIAGSKNVFYSIFDEQIIFSSDINYIIDYFRLGVINYSFNKEAAKSMLSHQFLDNNITFFNEIKRLHHGFCLIIKDNSPEIIQYYEYKRKPLEGRNENEILQEFDKLFRNAVDIAYKKDIEYGYNHIACLSAGQDCKMVTYIANKLGYNNQTNITYSQPDFLDDFVPKQIAADLGHRYIFQSLANGLFLLDIDGNIKDNAGCYYYAGIAQGKEAFSEINMDKYGLIHTGLFSDITRGRFIKTENEENFLYQIGSNSENTQFVGLSNITEPYSPFFNRQLIEYCLSVPIHLISDSKMYHDWIINIYPQAAAYLWSKNGMPLGWKKGNLITKIRLGKHMGKSLYRKMKPLFNRVLRKTKITNKKSISEFHMNPIMHWYDYSPVYRETCDRYFNENIDKLLFDSDFHREASEIYYNSLKPAAKSQVLTILAVLKNYF
jgi:asparagine synthase (glutamine-hydrolysing)